MSSSQVISFVVALVVGVGVGYYIGNRKGRPTLGALLGLLGCIGWIIIAVIPRREQAPGGS